MRDESDPFDVSDLFFVSQYRLSKSTAKYIIDLLGDKDDANSQNSSIPFPLRVLCTLHFYGHGSFQKPTGTHYNLSMSQSSVSRCIHQITHLIEQHLAPIFVQFPTTEESKLAVKQGFYTKFGLPGILGAIDGVHIAIQSPPNNDHTNPGHLYRNRKGYHSINAMVACDSNLTILFADTRYPGSVHDSAVWQVSNLKQQIKSTHNGNSWLLGDSGYPIEPWLLTPFINPRTQTEKLYNKLHIKARNVIERCFGVLKSRFRCLHKYRTLHYSPSKTSKIINAVITLHNLCIKTNEPLIDEEYPIEDGNDNEEYIPEHAAVLQEGRLSRQNYMNNIMGRLNLN